MAKRLYLPDLWWIQGQHWAPQAYTCPLLMTFSMWLMRLCGKPARWAISAGNPARVITGDREIGCVFPRRMIIAECDFWNRRRGGTWRSRYEMVLAREER